MILDIFLPRKVGQKRILSSHVLGFSIQENEITAAYALHTSSKMVVEKVFKEIIEQGEEVTFVQRAAQAIKKITTHIKKYDEVRVTIPASIVVFKELTVPFVDPQKIRMVIEYEVEPMLPFALENAVIDFVILDQNKKEGKSSILAVAARVQDLENILSIYRAADIEPTHLVVDLLSLYDLYQEIPEYQEIRKGSALIDIGPRVTRLVFLQDGQFRLMRNIMRGLATITENMSRETGIPLDKIQSSLEKNGASKINEDAYDKSLEKHLVNLCNDIQFTLNSFSIKLNFQDEVTKLLFTGPGAQLKGLVKYSASVLQIPSDVFEAEKIFTNKLIKNKVADRNIDWNQYLFALACALPSKRQDEFNLRRKTLTVQNLTLISKQWLTASIFSFVLISLIALNGYFQLSYLTKDIKTFEEKEIQKLKKILPSDSKAFKKKLVLKTLLKDAETYVAEKQELWAPFSPQRHRPLEVLQELTRLIDKKRFEVTIDEVEIISQEGTHRIEVTGFFRSKTGYHFQEFGVFQKTFSESKTLVLTEEIDPTLADEKGVKFTAKLKPREV